MGLPHTLGVQAMPRCVASAILLPPLIITLQPSITDRWGHSSFSPNSSCLPHPAAMPILN